MSNIFTGTVKEINRVALASTKKYLFNTNRIGELKADSTDSVFPYTENKLGDRYASTEYKLDDTKAAVDAIWSGYENQISLAVLQKKVGSKLYDYANTISLNIADIAFGWADPNDATKSWIEVYPSGFNKIIYHVNLPLAALNGIANVLTYSFLNAPNAALSVDVAAVVNWDAGTIAATVPALTVVTALVGSFTLSTGSTLKVSSTLQSSGVTANDFTNPITYICTAANGLTKNFVCTVTVTP